MNETLSGPGRLVQHAIYVYRGLSAREDFETTIERTEILVTASADTAVRRGLPPGEHRPSLAALFGGVAPAVVSREQTAARLGRLMTIGSAVCLRTTIPVTMRGMTVGWREAAGVGFAEGQMEDEVAAALSAETRALFALGVARPCNNSHMFEVFDRAAVLWPDSDARPVSLARVTASLGGVWVSGPLEELDQSLLQGIGGAEGGLPMDEGLLYAALDAKAEPLASFLAAWAALERLVGKAYKSHLGRFLAAPSEDLGPSLRDAQTRVRDAGSSGPSLINQFLILRWGLDPVGVENDEIALRRLNKRRALIYHKGEVSELWGARGEAVQLLMTLYRLSALSDDRARSS